MSREEIFQVSQEAFAMIKAAMHESEGWEEWEKSKKAPNVDALFSKATQGTNVRFVKSYGPVPAEPKLIHSALWEETEADKKKDDPTTLAHQLVEEYDEHLQVVYQEYKVTWPMSNRDFVFLRWQHCDEKGVWYNINRSVEHPKKPLKKGNTRAHIHNSAYVCAPDGNGGSRVYYLVQMDPGGYVPSSIVNSNAKRVSERVQQIHDRWRKQKNAC